MQAAGQFVGLCWIAFLLVWVIGAVPVKRSKVTQPLFGGVLYVWLIAVVALLLNDGVRELQLTRAVLPHTLGTALLADFLVLADLAIAVWARVVLGGNWSARVTLKENPELIQRGPYRLGRHPIHSGLLLMILGTAVLVGHPSGFLALPVRSFGFWIKLRQEERLLIENLPGYSKYMARTKALVPYLL